MGGEDGDGTNRGRFPGTANPGPSAGCQECIRLAPRVAEIMARELGYDKNWEKKQVQALQVWPQPCLT